MSERTLQEVHQDYSNICAKLGHTVFQLSQLDKDVEILTKELQDLNFEGAKINAKAAEDAKAANKATEELAARAAGVKFDAETPSDAQVVS